MRIYRKMEGGKALLNIIEKITLKCYSPAKQTEVKILNVPYEKLLPIAHSNRDKYQKKSIEKIEIYLASDLGVCEWWWPDEVIQLFSFDKLRSARIETTRLGNVSSNEGSRNISLAQEQYARELPSADVFIVSAVWTDTSSLWIQVDPFNCHCNDWRHLAKKFARTIAKEAADTLRQSVCVHTYVGEGEFEEIGNSCQSP